MADLFKIRDEVKGIMETIPSTRSSDDLLYLAIIRKAMRGNYHDRICTVSIDTFFENRREYEIPGFESVRRARQKIQAEFPDLRGSKSVQDVRQDLQKEFIDFAIS